MTTRPVVFVFLLVVLFVTSQLEWKQQFIAEADAKPLVSRSKQQIFDGQEVIKEKIILSQEKNIQQLNELVQSLQRQLMHCRGSNNSIPGNADISTEHANETEREHIIIN